MMSRILPIFAVLIAIGIFVGYINPAYTGPVAALTKQIHDYNGALAASQQFSLQENQLTASRNAIPPEQISRLETYLPDGVDNVQLILDLDALAARSGLQLSNFDIQDTVAPNAAATADASLAPLALGSPATTDSLELSVKATGTYSAFRTFIAGVEQSLRPLDIVELNITDSPTGVYTYEMTFRIYWLH